MREGIVSMSEYKRPNLFYKNLDKNYTALYNSIQFEADYYHRTIHKVIKNLDTSKYGLEWKKIENFTYKIYIPNIIIIFKPKFEIKIEYNSTLIGSDDQFNLKYLTMDWEPFDVVEFRFQKNNILFETEIQYSPNQELRYKGQKLDWTFQGGFDLNRLENIQDADGNKIELIKSIERSDHIEIQLKSRVTKRSYLQHFDGTKIDFKIKSNNPYHSEYRDDIGEVPINQIMRDKGFILHSSRELKGKLWDIDNSLQINYKKQKNVTKEIWIELIEKDISDDTISAGTSAVELFIELLLSSEYREISDGERFKKSNMIKVKKINFEEFSLLVDRVPTGKFIYPPKSDSQLKKQKWALEILKDYPSPQHRGLLKLFEKENHVTWKDFSINHSLDWKFLVPIEGKLRQGTNEQRQFVLKAINSPDYAILEGPPGSGKTTALTELIYQLILQKKRILLSASTHVAIDNVIEKLMEQFGDAEALMENGIVPLRIGVEKNLDITIIPFQIDVRKEALLNKLSLHKLFNDDSQRKEIIDKYLSHLVMMSSNLVCGTTIGILQYPNFKASKIAGHIEPEFDYLIIDEASKTTVQQFLVPAINAKRWVIAGDIQQLSPYMESLHIRVSLEGMLGKPIETALLLFFVFIYDQANQRIDKGKLPRYVIPVSTATIKEFLKIISQNLRYNDPKNNKQTKAIKMMEFGIISSQKIKLDSIIENNVEIINSNNIRGNYEKIFKILNFDLLLVSDHEFDKIKSFIPATHMILSNNFSENMVQHLFKHEYWYFSNNKPYYLSRGRERESSYEKIRDSLVQSLSKNWSGQLSWRLSRVYELEEVTEDSRAKNYYKSSIHALVPQGKRHYQLWREIQRMGQIFFPSILKCLQMGIKGEYRISENNTIISNGMDPQAFENRHCLLRFQHRMHDEIAQVPRELFYTNKENGQDRNALLTSKGIEREWPNEKHPLPQINNKRLAWIHVKGMDTRNRNDKEASIIIDHLNILSNWVEKNSKKKNWNLAIITYYNKQRDVIANRIKRYFPKVNQRAKVHFNIDRLRVMVYTVDKIQGREADFVLISMVRNSKLGFMDSPNRLNVGITRARYLQIIYGNADYFNTCDSKELRDLVGKIQTNNALFLPGSKNQMVEYKAKHQHQKSRNQNYKRRVKS